MGFPTLASEFPNDNCLVSSGAIWICAEVVGPATASIPPYAPVPAEAFVLLLEDEDAALDAPVAVYFDERWREPALFRAEPEPEALAAEPEALATEPEALAAEPEALAAEPEALAAEPEAPPALRAFESALITSLMAQGASRSAALVPLLLRLETLPAEALSKDVHLTLQSRGYLDGSGRYSLKFRELCGAWCAVLCGSSQDFSACGTTTLDRFGADLLAALLAVPATRADDLRRELRKRGVAAFGVLEAAA